MKFHKFLKIVLLIFGFLLILYSLLSLKSIPKKISYGVSFSKFHSDELELPWKDVYNALLHDLGVKKFRLSAHWPMIEPQKGEYHFDELDYQVSEAAKNDTHIILVVGRRTPVWPECHEPDWAKNLSWDEKKKDIIAYIQEVVERYKTFKNIDYWQIENEPFLSVFAKENCGDLDKSFLDQEVALVKKLDPTRQVLVTDSGNLGTWSGAWKEGDLFGTSVYLYLWNPSIGQVKTILPPSFYRVKRNVMELLFGNKKSILIELSLEPWLLQPAVKTDLQTQIDRMGIEKFDEIIQYAKATSFDEQYLWGVEWWYWMKTQGHDEYWKKAQEIFSNKI
jgi:hypothetical protein